MTDQKDIQDKEMEDLDSHLIHGNAWFRVLSRIRRLPTGARTFYRVEFPCESVSALVWRPSGHIALIEEYRDPLSHSIWDLPAGVIDQGETAIRAGSREAAEELGLLESHLGPGELLATYFNSPGTTDQRMTLIAYEASMDATIGNADPHEECDIKQARWADRNELREVLAQGTSAAVHLASAFVTERFYRS